MIDWYSELGVSSDITDLELEQLRIAAQKQLHEDRYVKSSAAEKTAAAAKLRRILEGVDFLLNPRRRAQLDQALASGTLPPRHQRPRRWTDHDEVRPALPNGWGLPVRNSKAAFAAALALVAVGVAVLVVVFGGSNNDDTSWRVRLNLPTLPQHPDYAALAGKNFRDYDCRFGQALASPFSIGFSCPDDARLGYGGVERITAATAAEWPRVPTCEERGKPWYVNASGWEFTVRCRVRSGATGLFVVAFVKSNAYGGLVRLALAVASLSTKQPADYHASAAERTERAQDGLRAVISSLRGLAQ